MSIDEQVKRLRQQADSYHRINEFSTSKLLNDAADTIERLNTEWVSVHEKLPPVGEDVLVCDMDGDIYITHRIIDGANRFRCYDEGGNKIKGVRAWRRIPEPYNGGEG